MGPIGIGGLGFLLPRQAFEHALKSEAASADEVDALCLFRAQRFDELVFGGNDGGIEVLSFGFGAKIAEAGMEVYLGAEDIARAMVFGRAADLDLGFGARVGRIDIFIELLDGLFHRRFDGGRERDCRSFESFFDHVVSYVPLDYTLSKPLRIGSIIKKAHET